MPLSFAALAISWTTTLLMIQSDPSAPDSALAEPSPQIAPAVDTEPLNLSFTLYGWLTGFEGTTGIEDVTTSIDISFTDILDQSDSLVGLMGVVDAEYKRFLFQFNGVYTSADFEEDKGRFRTGPAGATVSAEIDLDLELDAAWLEAFAGYRFIDRPLSDDPDSNSRFCFDAFAGVRLTMIQTKADLKTEAAVTLPRGRTIAAGEKASIDENEGWAEPFVGAQARIEFAENWAVALRGDVGGFGFDGAQFSWQGIGGAGYRTFHEGWELNFFAGYRALSQDYENDGFTWDVVTHGPIIGLTFAFNF